MSPLGLHLSFINTFALPQKDMAGNLSRSISTTIFSCSDYLSITLWFQDAFLCCNSDCLQRYQSKHTSFFCASPSIL